MKLKNLYTLIPRCAAAVSYSPAAMAPDDIQAGLDSHDRALHIKDGWIRDPYIYLASDGFYYLTGTTPEPGDPREFCDPYNTGLDDPEITGTLKPAVVGEHDAEVHTCRDIAVNQSHSVQDINDIHG